MCGRQRAGYAPRSGRSARRRPRALRTKPAFRRRRTAPTSPLDAAYIKGVVPWASVAVTRAPGAGGRQGEGGRLAAFLECAMRWVSEESNLRCHDARRQQRGKRGQEGGKGRHPCRGGECKCPRDCAWLPCAWGSRGTRAGPQSLGRRRPR